MGPLGYHFYFESKKKNIYIYIYSIESNVHITFFWDNDRFQICDKGKLLSLRDGRVWTNLGGPLFLQGHDLVPKPKG